MVIPSIILPEHEHGSFIHIWLDSRVDTSEDNLHTQNLLREAFPDLKTFNGIQECVDHMRAIIDKRIVFIVSGQLGQEILPKIHGYPSLVAVYVFCRDKERNESWAYQYNKVKRVMVKPKKLIAQIQLDEAQHNHYSMDQVLPISVFHQDLPDVSPRYEQNQIFVYQQLLIDCLSRIHSITYTKDEFVQLCRVRAANEKIQLELIDEFDRHYSSDRALWWFTRDSYIKRLLIEAFETMDIDLLYASHFLLRDIREQMEAEPNLQSLCVYRAQLMSTNELKQWKASIGEMISINTFLSTNLDRERAIHSLKDGNVSKDMKRVLFEIDVDPSRMRHRVCSDISMYHYYNGTQVILFTPGSIFYPIDISVEDDLVIIQMLVGNDEHDEIQGTIDLLNIKYYDREGETNLLVLGQILFRMGRIADAQKCYQRLLNELPNDHALIAHCYQDLGQMMVEIQDYDTGLRWYSQSLEIYQTILRTNDPEIAATLCEMGHIYSKKKSLSDALECYRQAIDMYSLSLGKDHNKVLHCYRSMGIVCEENENYQQALEFYQIALSIRKKHSLNHCQDLADLHRRIAHVYDRLNDKHQALKYYHKSLKIFQTLDSTCHIDVINTMRSIALVYESIGRCRKALTWFKRVANEV